MVSTLRTILFAALLALGTTAVAQVNGYDEGVPDSVWDKPKVIRNHFRNEILAITENDNYTLQIRDGYYTNGIFFRYSRAMSLKNRRIFGAEKMEKVIQAFELGQQIYNPVRFDSINVETQDRPFAGYLYGRFQQTLFPKPNTVLQWSLSLGTIGTHSFAREVQRWYHAAIDIYDVQGWQSQLRTEASINLAALYSISPFKKPVEKRMWDISPYAQTNLGNAYVDATVGSTFRFGKMENHMNSVLWNARVSADTNAAPQKNKELYLFFDPAVTWQGYNATLQGGMFLDYKGPKVAVINPFYYSMKIGFHLGQNRWSWKMYYVHRTRMVVDQFRKENFVSIQLAYRFGNLDK